MKTILITLTIKCLVICTMGQQPDTAERARSARSNAAKAKAVVKPAKNKDGISGGLLYRIPLSI
jgi:hypothetical protein